MEVYFLTNERSVFTGNHPMRGQQVVTLRDWCGYKDAVTPLFFPLPRVATEKTSPGPEQQPPCRGRFSTKSRTSRWRTGAARPSPSPRTRCPGSCTSGKAVNTVGSYLSVWSILKWAFKLLTWLVYLKLSANIFTDRWSAKMIR